jgi:predicted Holliday junction resolvase-like endonuclease
VPLVFGEPSELITNQKTLEEGMQKQTIIEQVHSIKGLKFECPNCGEESFLKRARLFDLRGDYPKAALEIMRIRAEDVGELINEIHERREKLAEDRLARPQRHERGAHSSNFGKGMEHVIPAFLTFPYIREECRVVLQPVDYIAFQGLSNAGRVESIQFVEVKTGNGRLNDQEASVQSAVLQKRISHQVVCDE